jgi:hypothetical protein
MTKPEISWTKYHSHFHKVRFQAGHENELQLEIFPVAEKETQNDDLLLLHHACANF